MFKQVGEIRQAELQRLGWLAWHVGLLSQVPLKKYPDLTKITGPLGTEPERKAQTPEEMLAAVRAIKKAMKGE